MFSVSIFNFSVQEKRQIVNYFFYFLRSQSSLLFRCLRSSSRQVVLFEIQSWILEQGVLDHFVFLLGLLMGQSQTLLHHSLIEFEILRLLHQPLVIVVIELVFEFV